MLEWQLFWLLDVYKRQGYTGLYGIVANPIRHSFSPMMHNTAFQTLGIDDVYLAFEVAENQLSDYITLSLIHIYMYKKRYPFNKCE